MNWFGRSLRMRLSLLILVPLILVSCVAIYWRFENARQTAEDIFDKNLVMLSLAVSRDVAYSGGDTLSATTSNLFRDASGGAVFYHVYGPDGSFVTGYSSPPIRRGDPALELNSPFLFDAVYQGDPVRAARLAERVEVDGISGVSVITVWQRLQPRETFAQALAVQAAALALVLILTVAALVVFGIRLGLRPLDQLEAAIQKRSATDLSPIERQIPAEAKGIVHRLNTLFGALTDAKAVQDRLISNAAHQLRNSVAAIHTMAEATLAAKTFEASKDRAAELVTETRQTVRMTRQQLSVEGIKGVDATLKTADLNAFVRGLAQRLGSEVLKQNVDFELSVQPTPLPAQFDETLLAEAITNLVDNALRHGGDDLGQICLRTRMGDDGPQIIVENDGLPIVMANTDIFERFAQGTESSGSGLGLSIVHEIAKLHGGKILIETAPSRQFHIVLSAQA